MTKNKPCTKCKESKSFDNYYKDKRGQFGLVAICKVCHAAYSSKYNLDHKEELVGIRYAQRQKHKDRIRAYKKSPKGKDAAKRTIAKNANAAKSRAYYKKQKHKLVIPDQCQRCDDRSGIEAHHEDYNKPMDVIYLCKRCHTDEHMNNTPLNRESGIFTEKKKYSRLELTETKGE